jgi:hypothetical protein
MKTTTTTTMKGRLPCNFGRRPLNVLNTNNDKALIEVNYKAEAFIYTSKTLLYLATCELGTHYR